MSWKEKNTSCQVTIRLWSGNAPLKEVGELYGAPQRRPPPPWLGHWEPSSKIRRVGRSSVSPGPLGAARDAEPRVYVPSREVFRSFERAGRAQTLRGGTGRVPACDCPPTPLPSRQVPYRSKCTMLLPPWHSLVPVGRFRRGLWLPPPPRSLTANIVPTVTVYGHPTL